jgi:hypothetical protein
MPFLRDYQIDLTHKTLKCSVGFAATAIFFTEARAREIDVAWKENPFVIFAFFAWFC